MKVTFREYLETDAERLVQLANNFRVAQYLVDTFPHPYTLNDAEWWIREGNFAESISRVVELDGVFVGGVGITPQKGWRKHQAEIGYWLAEEYWGRGITTVALKQMTDIAFSEYKFRKLFAPVLSPNLASTRVLEKCGYVREGLHKGEVYRNGQFYDTIRFAKYAPDWDYLQGR